MTVADCCTSPDLITQPAVRARRWCPPCRATRPVACILPNPPPVATGLVAQNTAPPSRVVVKSVGDVHAMLAWPLVVLSSSKIGEFAIARDCDCDFLRCGEAGQLLSILPSQAASEPSWPRRSQAGCVVSKLDRPETRCMVGDPCDNPCHGSFPLLASRDFRLWAWPSRHAAVGA